MRLLVVGADAPDRASLRAAWARPEILDAASVADGLAALETAAFDAALVAGELAEAFATALRSAGHALAVIALAAEDDALPALLAAGVTDVLAASDRAPHRLALRVDHAIRVARATVARAAVLSIVSHDLRGPLHAIGLAVEALRDDVPASSQRFLGAIDRAAGRAERLIAELLEASAIENGALELARYPVDAASVVRQAAADHRDAAAESGAAISTTLPADALAVHADRDRVLQVLGILIGNALRHARGAAIELTIERGAATARIAVRDRGPGIAATELPHLFDRYGRGRPKRGGAGLGLAIAQGIVIAHGGEITAHAAAGGGTEVAFTLPLVN